MKHTINKVLIGIMLLTLTACKTVETYNPFNETTKEEVVNSVKTVALVPTEFSIKLDESKEQEAAAAYNRLIKEAFVNAGYQVIDSSEYAAIWNPIKEQAGGLFDKDTGEFDSEKFAAIRDIAKKEMSAKHDFDAYVMSDVIVVKASWNANVSRWHGATAPTTGKTGFWAAMATSSNYGTIPAYSLLVRLTDHSDNVLFADFGGIELASVLQGGSFVDIPTQELFLDEERNNAAVSLATGALLGSSSAAK